MKNCVTFFFVSIDCLRSVAHMPPFQYVTRNRIGGTFYTVSLLLLPTSAALGQQLLIVGFCDFQWQSFEIERGQCALPNSWQCLCDASPIFLLVITVTVLTVAATDGGNRRRMAITLLVVEEKTRNYRCRSCGRLPI